MSLFQEEVAEQRAAIRQLETEKLTLEREKRDLSESLNTAKAHIGRLERDLDQANKEADLLERKLGQANADRDVRAEIERARNEAEALLQNATAALADESKARNVAEEQIIGLEKANGTLNGYVKELEREVLPMRALVQAMKDRLDADRRIEAETGRL